MSEPIQAKRVLAHFTTSLRVALLTMAVCCLLYSLMLLVIGGTIMPYEALGSLVRGLNGKMVGSELIAQGFMRDEYFWPRPSAVQYDASAAGGSNWSPSSRLLRDRAEEVINKTGASSANLLPKDLAAASGSGLDPHVTLASAKYQARRVASARGMPLSDVEKLLERHAIRPGGPHSRSEPIVNVLLVNLALDRGGF